MRLTGSLYRASNPQAFPLNRLEPEDAMRMELERALALNRIWQPIATVSLRHALTLVFRGRARIVEPGTFQLFSWEQWLAEKSVPADAHVLEGDYLRTAARLVLQPEVVTLARFAGFPNRGVPFSRRAVYERDNGRCQYCNRPVHKRDMTLDHVVPVSRGGGNTWLNCVLACVPCNQRKADRTPAEAGMALRREPEVPTRSQLLLRGVAVRPAWAAFLRDDKVVEAETPGR